MGIASLMIAGVLAGCEDNPPQTTLPSRLYQKIQLSNGFVAEGMTEEIDSPKGKVTLVHTEHGSRVYIQDGKALFWVDNKGVARESRPSYYFNRQYPTWDYDGYKPFINDKDTKLPAWAERIIKATSRPQNGK